MARTTDKPVLIVREGETAGKRWVLHNNEMLIGRGSECDIVLPERQVSRLHARVRREGEEYYIEDLDSKNGTYVNGQPLKGERQLHDGDDIQIALAVRVTFLGSEATLPLDSGRVAGQIRRLRLDRNARRVFIGEKEIDPHLSLPQYRLLELLVDEGGAVCTRDEVVTKVWPDVSSEGVSEQAIDALARRLRDRLADLDPDHQYVVTVRGHGFRLDNPLA
jgi:DNA-binding response OmpR family regulator